MPSLKSQQSVPHHLQGVRFDSYVAPSLGSTQLCAWRVEVGPGTNGASHRVSHEEVLLILDGAVRVHLDGTVTDAAAGDVVLVPAGTTFALDNAGPEPASAWVTTSVGFDAELADGTRLQPPWTR